MPGHFPRRRLLLFAVSASLLASVLATPATTFASGDHHGTLNQQKSHLDVAIRHEQSDLDETSKQFIKAEGRLASGISQLHAARARLAYLQAEVAKAQAADDAMQRQLAAAELRLHTAQADLANGHDSILTQRQDLISYAVSNYQAGGLGLTSLGVAFGSSSAQQTVDRLQAVDAAEDKQDVDLQRLQANQVFLRLTQQQVAAAEERVAVAKAQSARLLAHEQAVAAQASSAARAVADRVAALRRAKAKAAVAKKHEIARIKTMKTERDRLAAKLRKLAAERAARHHATLASPASHQGGWLSYPSPIHYITSPYGMRFHPILHIWELHDGTDFALPCGSPVYAAATGRVTSEYFNVGYGNRLILDHGYVHGVSLQTSYNHLSSYVAHVGQSVHRGQLIAYSGTTGWSTGCHLHFMVYVNGHTVNPMTWL